MGLSEILNVVLGGSLVSAIVSIVTIRSALKKARSEAEKAMAESDTVKITNTEQATRILGENIVNPLKEELNETRKEVVSLKREVARFRKAVDSANSCRYNDDCPVLDRMRNTPKEHDRGHANGGSQQHRQRDSSVAGQPKRAGRNQDGADESADVVSDADDSDGQPP